MRQSIPAARPIKRASPDPGQAQPRRAPVTVTNSTALAVELPGISTARSGWQGRSTRRPPARPPAVIISSASRKRIQCRGAVAHATPCEIAPRADLVAVARMHRMRAFLVADGRFRTRCRLSSTQTCAACRSCASTASEFRAEPDAATPRARRARAAAAQRESIAAGIHAFHAAASQLRCCTVTPRAAMPSASPAQPARARRHRASPVSGAACRGRPSRSAAAASGSSG